jgi:hypothetical protein
MTYQPPADPLQPAPAPAATPYPGQYPAQHSGQYPNSYPGQFSVPAGFPAPVAPPPVSGHWQPERIDAVAGTEFGLVQLKVEPILSGLAIGSLIAGVGSILVSFLVLCFGLAGARAGWGGWVSGAFTLLSVVTGGGGLALGLVSRRQIRLSGKPGRVRFTGSGMAMAGLVCGCAGAGIALACLVLSLVLQASLGTR